MAIVEVFLGAILPVLIEKLASGELQKFLRRVGIDAQLKEWGNTLLMFKAVLTDAENKQTANEPVKKWLNDLEDLAYDLEDLVDDLNTEALQRNLRENKGSTSKVKKLIPTCCTNLSYADFMFERGIASKLKEISGRLDALYKKIKVLRLVENVIGTGRPYERTPATSLVVESEVYGREEDKEKILKILLSVESNGSPISVIPIVGMGGVGKTTLAKLVYNDKRVKDKFDLKAWACVSDEFNAVRVTKDILEEVSGEKYDSENFNMLQVKLKESLSNKKFLVVLDDIWSENSGDWDDLRLPFLAGKPGSKIIITTRNEPVAKIMSKIPLYHLERLSEDDALSLLAQHAFEAKNFDAYPELIEIGKTVVKRCKKLPLAVKALGRLLWGTVDPEEWEKVLKNEIWMEEGRDNIILPALKLSYHYLPPQLKRCFAYCSLFPKDYEFDKVELVSFWMVEGLLQESKKGMSMEDVGSQYFDELWSRSFFEQSSARTSRFVMHDLFNDLATSVAGDKCLRLDDAPNEVSEKVRHLSFMRRSYETHPRFDFLNKVQKLRTFLPLPVQSYLGSLSRRILLHLLPNLNCLRMLSLNGYSINELPDSIGELRHLRYLSLAYNTRLRWLPESVSTLINLQVLILRRCWELTKLPTRMEDLINLRHLDISGTGELHEMPQGIAQLTSLRTLTKVTVSKNNGMRLKDLGNLSFLQGEISIEELQNVNVQEAMDARLMDKPSLNEIWLKWSGVSVDSRNEIFESDVLNALQPHKNLSTLGIKYYGGENFSNWIGDSAFVKLAKISFESCKNCTTLPPLGQLPLLRKLRIQGMDQIKVIGAEFYGNRGHGEVPFPSLISLAFDNMCSWEEWVGIEGVIELPRLTKLEIRSCSKLVRLPNLLLSSLCKLEARECNVVVLNRMQNLEFLTEVQLHKIFGLTLVPESFVQFPFTLERLNVMECDDLVTLWPSDSTARDLVNLRKVCVRSCPQLRSLQEIDVLPGLRNLEINNCKALELLPNKISYLEQLTIKMLPSLKTMMKLQDCSTSLEHLSIFDCVNLNLTNFLGSGHSYHSLTGLRICSYDGLESFPNGGLSTPNLRDLSISDCKHLKSLPNRMELLSSLSGLGVYQCASLVELFPQDNIPPNLSILEINDCGKLKPLVEWNLHKLTSLIEFKVSGCEELVSFTNSADEEHYVLPPSLIELRLDSLPNLKTLSKGLQNLSSLQLLQINKCPKLVALPRGDQLCKLSSLRIFECPRLKKRCSKNKGDIADIPDLNIDFDWRSICDPCP